MQLDEVPASTFEYHWIMAEPINVLIVDDHTMFADGLSSLLASATDIRICGQAHSGEDALAAISNLDPDVTLLDIGLPDMDGIQVCALARAKGYGTAIVGLSMHEEEAFITGLLEAGANGYLLKSATPKELIAAIRSVHSGESFYSKKVTQTLIDGMLRKQRSKSDDPTEEETIQLSEREQQVLELIVKEFTTSEIAETLFISNSTVETHRRHLLEKLGARNTAGLVRIAFEKGLIDTTS